MDPTSTQVGGDHYRTMAIQTERFIYENGIGFHEGCAIKYLCRWRRKGGVHDLEKAKHFINLLLAHQPVAVQPEPPPPAPAPDAPDPGPGWRLLKAGEMISKGDQWWDAERQAWITTAWHNEGAYGHPYRTPIYHNPANLETAGEGYRFCLVSETRQDATHMRACYAEDWCLLHNANSRPDFAASLTYRTNKPLPTT